MKRLLAWIVPTLIAPKTFDWYWHIEGVNCNQWCRAVRHNRPKYDWTPMPPYPVPGQPGWR